MYSEGYIIYGIPFTEKFEKIYNDKFGDGCGYDNGIEYGFKTIYSGASDFVTGWFGIAFKDGDKLLGLDAFDSQPVFSIIPPENQIEEAKKEYQALLDNLPEDLKEVLAHNGVFPDVYIVWGTS